MGDYTTTEAGYMSLTEATKEGIWLKGLVSDFGSTSWSCDNVLWQLECDKLGQGSSSSWEN